MNAATVRSFGALTVACLCLLLMPIQAHCADKGERLTPRQFSAIIDARNFMESGQPDEAIKKLAPLVKSDKPPLTLLSHLAWAKSDSGDTDGALAVYQRAAELYPEDPSTVRNLGIMLLNKGNFLNAATALEHAFSLQAENAKEPALLVQAAYALMHVSRFERALDLLSRVEQAAHTVPLSWTSMEVQCCLRLHRIKDAVAHARTGTRQHAHDPKSWTLLSRVLVRSNDPLGAAGALEAALLVNDKKADQTIKTDVNRLRELAGLYARGHAYTEAARHLTTIDTENASILAARFLGLEKRYEEALQVLDKINPTETNLEARVLRGRLLLEMGKTEDGITVLVQVGRTVQHGKQASRLRSRALLLAGETLWLKRRWVEAARIFDSLASVPGMADTGASLAAGMRALIREQALLGTE